MTDLANLSIKVDAAEINAAVDDLHNLAAAARGAEVAAANMARSFREMATQAAGLRTALSGVNQAASSANDSLWDWVERVANVADIISAVGTIKNLSGALSEAGRAAPGAAGALGGLSASARSAAGAAGLLRGGLALAGQAFVPVTVALAVGGVAIRRYTKSAEDLSTSQAIVAQHTADLKALLDESKTTTDDLTGSTDDSAASSLDAADAYDIQAAAARRAARDIREMTKAEQVNRMFQLEREIKEGNNRISNNNIFKTDLTEAADNSAYKVIRLAKGRAANPYYNTDAQVDEIGRIIKSYPKVVQDAYAIAVRDRDNLRTERLDVAAKTTEYKTTRDHALSPQGATAEPTSGDPPKPPQRPRGNSDKSGGGSGRSGSMPALANERAELEASTQQTLALAQAYLQSDAAAMKAEASRLALAGATRGGASAEAHLAHAVAEQALAGAKSVSDLRAKAAAQKVANDAVASGTMTSEQARQQMEASLSLRALETAKDAASGEQKKALEGVINDLTTATKDWNAEQARGEVLQATEDTQRKIELLNTEFEMIGKTNGVRAVAIAQKEAEQFLDQKKITDPDARAEYIKSQTDLAAQTANLRVAQDNYNGSLNFTLDLLGQMHAQAQNLAAGLSEAFGAPGAAIGKLLTSFTGLKTELEEIRLRYEKMREAATPVGEDKDGAKAAAAQKRLSEINILAAKDEAKARQQAYGSMISAAKGFFKEGSDGYKVMEAAERAYMAFQLVQTAQQIGLFGAKAAAGVTAGAATMFGQSGWGGFAGVAAMLAVMASLGFAGGGGGSSAPKFDLKDVQEKQGTGSVLGSDQKSESLKNALDDALETQEKMAGYQNVMVSHLRSIDTKIGAFATSLVKQISGGKLLATKELNLGTSGRPASLFNLGFGNTTNRTLQDQGLTFSSASVADIINKGISGSSYQDVLVNTVKKAFGITYSNKTSVQRSGGALGDDFTGQVQDIIASIRDGIIEAAGVLGLEGAEATIDAFQVSLGEISLKDMSGEEIQETLNAVFGKLADDMAAFVGGDLLDQYQKIGEGQFETMVRLANGLQVVRAQLESAGVAFNSVGVAAVNASQNMINAAGGLDAFVSGMEFFTQNFMTEAERMAITTERVTAAMAGLGLAGVTTIEQFKAAMQSALAIGDAVQVGKLMDVQKDFLDVAKYQEKQAEAQAQVAASAASAASSLSQVNDGFGDLIKNLKKFRDELLKGPAANLSPEEQYRIAAADFDRVSKLAASGDQQAQSELQTVSQALLTASKAYFASSQGYNDDFQRVLAVLDKIVGARPETVGLIDQTFPGDRPPPPTLTRDVARSLVANDNEEIADLLRAVKDELRAANVQRGAVGEAQLKRLERVCDQLDATKRELARA